MPQRYRIFCVESAQTVTADYLHQAILATDLRTAGENEGVSPALVEAAIENMTMSGTATFEMFALEYPPGRAPIEIQRWALSDQRLQQELLEELRGDDHPSKKRIAAWLEKAQEVVEVSFAGTDRTEAMGPVLARAIATCLTGWFGGIVQRPNGSWWEFDPTAGLVPMPADPFDPAAASTTLQYARPTVKTGKPSRLIGPVMKPQAGPVVTLPSRCPACDSPLRTKNRDRPKTSLSSLARALVILAAVTGTVVYLGSSILIWKFVRLPVAMPAALPALVLLPVAAIPVVPLGYAAAKMKRVVRLHCRNCGWRETRKWH